MISKNSLIYFALFFSAISRLLFPQHFIIEGKHLQKLVMLTGFNIQMIAPAMLAFYLGITELVLAIGSYLRFRQFTILYLLLAVTQIFLQQGGYRESSYGLTVTKIAGVMMCLG